MLKMLIRDKDTSLSGRFVSYEKNEVSRIWHEATEEVIRDLKLPFFEKAELNLHLKMARRSLKNCKQNGWLAWSKKT